MDFVSFKQFANQTIENSLKVTSKDSDAIECIKEYVLEKNTWFGFSWELIYEIFGELVEKKEVSVLIHYQVNIFSRVGFIHNKQQELDTIAHIINEYAEIPNMNIDDSYFVLPLKWLFSKLVEKAQFFITKKRSYYKKNHNVTHAGCRSCGYGEIVEKQLYRIRPEYPCALFVINSDPNLNLKLWNRNLRIKTKKDNIDMNSEEYTGMKKINLKFDEKINCDLITAFLKPELRFNVKLRIQNQYSNYIIDKYKKYV
jgi:hypothetical protein